MSSTFHSCFPAMDDDDFTLASLGENDDISCCSTSISQLTQESSSSSSGSTPKPLHLGTAGNNNGIRMEAESDVDKLLANDVAKMSIQDHASVLDDVYGFNKDSNGAPIETKDFVQSKLLALEAALQRIKQKAAYERALFLAPSYVRDPKLRLHALRIDRWNPDLAAQTLVGMYEIKQQIFPPEALGRPLLWDDLDDDTKLLVKEGAFTCFGHDQYGRSVFSGCVTSLGMCKSPISIRRGRWFNVWALQPYGDLFCPKGIVYVHHTYRLTMAKAARVFQLKVWSSDHPILPCRVAAIHICMESSIWKPLMYGSVAVAPRQLRVRIQFHFGSPLETQYKLARFGIPPDCLNFDADGTLRTARILQHMELSSCRERQAILKHHTSVERSTRGCSVVACPRPQDVLLGRGYSFQSFPGNTRLKELAQSCLAEFENSRKSSDKHQMIKNLVSIIQEEDGGRFLKRHGDHWEVVEDSVAYDKVSMLLRNQSRKKPSKSRCLGDLHGC